MGHRRFTRSAPTGVLIAAAAVLALAAAACTPPPTDTVAPELDVPPLASFVVGSQITRGSTYEPSGPDDTGEFTTGIAARVSWSATDAGSGVCGYDVARVFAGSEPETVVSNTTATDYEDTETDYDDQFGGGSLKLSGWNVTARDCAGNTVTEFVGGTPVVVQETGATASYGERPVTYTGTWGTSTCTCWSGGAVRRTTQAGATASFTVGPVASRVALVMEQSPDRGELTVLVDGEERGVVDTGTATVRHRAVVWAGAVPAGAVVEVVNEGTAGRPRIDLDAVLVRPA